MTTSKPEVRIDIDTKGTTCLAVIAALNNLPPGITFHESRDCRHPLGIYNISLNRLSDKIQKCCGRAESYFKASTLVRELRGSYSPLRREVIDYLELAIYAAAEHVDDAEAIAKCFFKTDKEFAKSSHTKGLKAELKAARDRISTFANLIKHRQSRIRMFSVEFTHDSVPLCLHALFAEEFSRGAVRPSPVLHTGAQQLFSLTGFLWEIVIFAITVSAALSRFVHAMSVVSDDVAYPSAEMANAVIALARLPLYSFDETHPFARTRVIVSCAQLAAPRLDSGLYGAFVRRWSKSGHGQFGAFGGEYEGDGVTKTFQTIIPQNLNLQYWE